MVAETSHEPEDGTGGGDATGLRRRRLPTYDVLWKRISQGVGLGLGVVEYVLSQVGERPPDPNILLLVSFLVGVPFVAGKAGGDGK